MNLVAHYNVERMRKIHWKPRSEMGIRGGKEYRGELKLRRVRPSILDVPLPLGIPTDVPTALVCADASWQIVMGPTGF